MESSNEKSSRQLLDVLLPILKVAHFDQGAPASFGRIALTARDIGDIELLVGIGNPEERVEVDAILEQITNVNTKPFS